MNGHKVASILIAVAVALMGFGVHKLRGRAVTASKAAESAQDKATQAEKERNIAEIKLKTIDAKTAETRKIYAEWLPHFEKYKDRRIAEQKIGEIVRDSKVFLLSQRFNYQELNKDDLVSHALVADLVIEDNYTKSMNWLGKMEEEIPSCRITKCKVEKGAGKNIHMSVKVQVPVLKRSLTGKKSKKK